jgi:hypothetical protein
MVEPMDECMMCSPNSVVRVGSIGIITVSTQLDGIGAGVPGGGTIEVEAGT